MNFNSQSGIPPPQSPLKPPSFLKQPSSSLKQPKSPLINFAGLELDPHKIINDHFHEDRKARAVQKLQKMYRYPAEYYLAEYHQRANRLGLSPPEIQFQGKKRRVPPCSCCQNFIISSQVPLCYRTFLREPREGQDKFLLPLSISIYFTFIKMVIILLILRFLIFDAYVAYSSTFGTFCANWYQIHHKECAITTSGFNLKGAANHNYLNVIDLLGLGFTVISIVYFVVLRKMLYRYEAYSKGQEFSDDQFSVLVERIPPFFFDCKTTVEEANYNYKKSIEETFNKYLANWVDEVLEKDYNSNMNTLEKSYLEDVLNNKALRVQERQKKVTGVSICYDLNELENINAMRDQILKEETAHQVESQIALFVLPDKLLSSISNRVTLLNHQYIKICESYTSNQNQISAFKLTHFTGAALVSFQFEHYKEYFLEKYEKDPNFFKISDRSIKISHASKPNDIYWYNMKIGDSARNKNIMYSWGVLFMLLILTLAGLLGLQFWKMSISAVNAGSSLGSRLKTMSLSGLMALLTTLLNYILSSSMELLSVMERHQTKSERLRSLVFKTIVSQTINTCFIYGIIHLIKPSFNILSSYGLVQQIMSLILVSGAVNLLLQIFIPSAVLNRVINHYTIDKTQPIKMFQIQLNRLIELPQFDFNQRYANYVIYTFVVCFYGFLIPLASLVLIFFFILQYWVDKYNLYRRFSTPIDFSFELTQIVISMFESSLLLFAVGNFLWDLNVHYDASVGFRIISILSIVLASIYTILSYSTTHSFKRKILKSEAKPCASSYTYLFSKKGRNTKTYFNQNPATFCLEDQRIFDYKVMYLLEPKQKQKLDKQLLGKIFDLPGFRSSSQSASLIFKDREIQQQEAALLQEDEQNKNKINRANQELQRLYERSGVKKMMTASKRMASRQDSIKQQQLRFDLNELHQQSFQIKMKLKDLRQKAEYNDARKSTHAKGSNLVMSYLQKLLLKETKPSKNKDGGLDEQSLLFEARNQERLQEQLYLKDQQLANWDFPEEISVQVPKNTKKDVECFKKSGKRQ